MRKDSVCCKTKENRRQIRAISVPPTRDRGSLERNSELSFNHLMAVVRLCMYVCACLSVFLKLGMIVQPGPDIHFPHLTRMGPLSPFGRWLRGGVADHPKRTYGGASKTKCSRHNLVKALHTEPTPRPHGLNSYTTLLRHHYTLCFKPESYVCDGLPLKVSKPHRAFRITRPQYEPPGSSPLR